MNYVIDEKLSSGSRLVLRRSYVLQVVLAVILYLLALPVLPVGLLLFLNPGMDLQYAFFWTGMGLLFLTGAVMVSTRIKMPRYIIFDNDRGMAIIREKENDPGSASISYGDIGGFSVRTHYSTRTQSYVVEMNKKDGAFWTLFTTGSEAKAEAFLGRLAGGVRLENAGGPGPKAGAPAAVEMITGTDSTILRWKKRTTVSGFLSSMLAIAAMAMVIFGAGPYVTSPAAYTFAKVFISAIIALALFNMVNSTGKLYSVEITADEFRYAVSGGLFKGPRFSMPIADIDAILFNFSVSDPDMALYVFRKEEKDLFQSIRRGDFKKEDIFKAIAIMRKVKRIDVGELPISGKVYLENLLQDIIFERSGRRGL